MGKQWQALFLGGCKITANCDCCHEIKRCLLLGRKFTTNLDSMLKSRDITLPTKVCIVKVQFSSSHVWMWELDHKEGWAPQNWCFWAVVLEKTLESPLDCNEIKPVIPIEISPEYSLERLMLKLKLQYYGHLIQRANSLEKNLVFGKTEDRRRRWQRMRWLDGITDSMDMSFEQAPGHGEGQGSLACFSPCGSQRVGHNWVTEQQK